MKDEWLKNEIADFKKMVIDQAVQIEILNQKVKDMEIELKQIKKSADKEEERLEIFSPKPRFWK